MKTHLRVKAKISINNKTSAYYLEKQMNAVLKIMRRFILSDMKIYRDIAERTRGEIYVGVVGPVRTGKSTLIKKFMEELVLPNIRGEFDRARARDEMPQSAGGRTVMTTEPKFIPDEAVQITLGDKTSARVKMVDCVGYMIPDALGGEEAGSARMVHTPWHKDPVPFEEAAEYGTRKVIADHATFGILVTSDGTVGDIPRKSYAAAEERVARELSELGKPFAIVLNSAHPESEEAVRLGVELEEKYASPVALVNVVELNADDIWNILALILDEFPAKQVNVRLPAWTSVLGADHKLARGMREAVVNSSHCMKKIRDVKGDFLTSLADGMKKAASAIGEYGDGTVVEMTETDAGAGIVDVKVDFPRELYFDVISEITGIPMKGEGELLEALRSLSGAKRELDKYMDAIRSVNETGYGIVMPEQGSLDLCEPEIIRQSGGYGVRLRASAPSIHMIKTTIETEINPIVGGEAQSEEMINYLMRSFEDDPKSIWESNMFGRSLYELVNDGLHTKLDHLPEDARKKLSETLSKIINEGSQGLICIIL